MFVLALTAFIAWERRYAASGRHPLVPLALFGVGSYRNGAALASVYFAAMPSMFLLTTLYLQHGLGLEAVFAGMVGIGFALLSAVGSWVGGNLVNRIGRPLVVWGLVILMVGIGLLVLFAFVTPPEVTPWAMAGAMTIGGVGGGLVISPNQTLTLADIPVRQGGLAGSVGQLGQRIGTAIGTAVTLSLFYSTIFRESSGSPDLAVYHDAYGVGMLAVAIFVAIAFGIGVADLAARRRERSALGGRRGGVTRGRVATGPGRSPDREDPRALVLVVVLDRGPERDPRHRRRVPFDELREPRPVDVAGGAKHPAECLLHERLGVVRELLGERVRVVELAEPQEREGRDECGATLGPEAGCREPAERRTVAGNQVRADDITRGEVDEVPLVDAIVPAEVQLVQLGAPLLRRLPVGGRLAHDAAGERAHLVGGRSSSRSSSATGRSSALFASSNTAPMRTPMNGASGSGGKYLVYFSRSASLAMPSSVEIERRGIRHRVTPWHSASNRSRAREVARRG